MRRLQEGDVIAAAVHGLPFPPVGIVEDLDDNGLSLRLYQWVSGTFGGKLLQVHRRDIRATMWADVMPAEQAKAAGYNVAPENVLYDMDPLAEFQTNWKNR